MGIPANHPAIRQAVKNGLIPGVELTKPKPAPSVATGGPVRWAVTLGLPVRVLSEANRREHWAVARRRKEDQRTALMSAFIAAGLYQLPVPCVVTLTHVGPVMDDDNLQRAFKALRDGVAEWAQVDDADPRIEWRYDQRRGDPAVEVRAESVPSTSPASTVR